MELNEVVEIKDIPKDSSHSELMDLMGDAIMKFGAAKKGLGLANKLKDPESRKKHSKAMMVNLNKLRGLMQRLDKSIAKAVKEAA